MMVSERKPRWIGVLCALEFPRGEGWHEVVFCMFVIAPELSTKMLLYQKEYGCGARTFSPRLFFENSAELPPAV
ncbi:unnamed protein product [Ectocarpus sp. 12 AP-2014]